MFTIWLTTMALGAALVGSPPTSPSSSRLRPLDAVARATIDAGRGQSRTFADLVDAVDRSDFVVYVECSRSMSRELRGELVHGRSSPRVLRVRLRLTPGNRSTLEPFSPDVLL